MEIAKAFGRIVNSVQREGLEKGLEILGLTRKKIELLVKKENFYLKVKNLML